MDFLTIVKAMAALSLVSLMFWMGLKARFEDVLASTKNFKLIGLGFLANFILVPILTLGLLYIFSSDNLVCVGFLVIAVCPGAPVGLPFVAMARGDVAVAISQMIVLSTISVFLSPLLLGLLFKYLFKEDDLVIDSLKVIKTLFLIQILPLALGFFVHHKAPIFAERSIKILGKLSNLLLIITVLLILTVEYKTLTMIRYRDWIAMLVLFFGSLGIGWICGGSNKKIHTTMVITTGIRNAAIALVIVSNNFSGTVAVTTVVAHSLLCILGGFSFAYFIKLGANHQTWSS